MIMKNARSKIKWTKCDILYVIPKNSNIRLIKIKEENLITIVKLFQHEYFKKMTSTI